MQVLTRGGHCARPSLWDDLFVTFARFVRVRDSGLRDATRRPRWRAPKLSMLGHGEKCILVACEICYGTAISCDRPAALKRDFPPHVYTHDRPHGTGTRRKTPHLRRESSFTGPGSALAARSPIRHALSIPQLTVELL